MTIVYQFFALMAAFMLGAWTDMLKHHDPFPAEKMIFAGILMVFFSAMALYPDKN